MHIGHGTAHAMTEELEPTKSKVKRRAEENPHLVKLYKTWSGEHFLAQTEIHRLIITPHPRGDDDPLEPQRAPRLCGLE